MDAGSRRPRARSLSIVLGLVGVVLLGFVVGAPSAAAAATHALSGSACSASSTPTWLTGDTWDLYGDVVVDTGCVLTIQPGVTVAADPGVHLYVNGTLWANGTEAAPIQFEDNQTTVTPWTGVQFNPGSQGSVAWSDFTRVQIAIVARSSSPAINNNTISLASAGVYLDTSSSLVADNTVDGQGIGSYGIVLAASDSVLEGNRVNGTTFGIQASGGNVTVAGNRITNTSGAVTIGVYLDGVSSVILTGNTIQTVVGRTAGVGGRGGTAVGVLINGTDTLVANGNLVEDVRGGRGGDGSSSAIGAGSPGGPGGAAAGIALGSVTTVVLQGNTATGIAGNRGGNGGSSSAGMGGSGGDGGIAFALELFSSTGNVSFLDNSVSNVTGGNGGAGGAGSLTSNGAGGLGGDAYGIFSPGGMNASVSGNTIGDLLGGTGGNTAVNTLPGTAGSGGNVTAAIVVVNGLATVHANIIDNLPGGVGGDGRTLGGAGGNATGVLAIGSGEPFNRTVTSYNRVSNITGGAGGVGGKLSGSGGNASAVAGLHVALSTASNALSQIRGGDGGAYGLIGNQASGGGFASGILYLEVPDGGSSSDAVRNVAAGASGGGASPPASYGVGYYFAGNATIETSAIVTNGTISGAGSFDLYADNYTAVTTLNTPFSVSKLAIMAAGNLTVQNFLGVRGYWPDNTTLVPGLSILVKDDATTVLDGFAPSGEADWIVVTNREYIGSLAPVYHTTNVSVSFGTNKFWDDPRFADMNASHTETFGMVDTLLPWSRASPLPAYESSDNFSVPYTYGDPSNGSGVKSVTLWYRFDGGAWTASPDQPSLGTPFAFTATADGVYEFATVAVDNTGNVQQPSPPTANDTWTVVDTVAPGSQEHALPSYETSVPIAVTWGPDAGVTDVRAYTVEYDAGAGWVTWLDNTTATSGTFSAALQGPIAFRSQATDFAGNTESKSGNDTWTVVDTVAPDVVAAGPSGDLAVSPGSLAVTFSEPMNASATEAAFSVAPSVPGAFTWSNGSRTLTFRPSQPFAPGTSYTVTVGTGATDLAGNPLAKADAFTFSTPAPSGISLLDLWPLFVVLAVALVGVALFLIRRRGTPSPEAVAEAPRPPPPAAPAPPEAAIDDVFLLYRKDGVLIKHETRRLRPDIDTDILSGMLTAVQQFVKDSFRGDEEEELNEMTVGQMHILIGRGKWLVLAATITGGDVASMTSQIEKCVRDMEDHNWDRLEDWNGDLEIAKALGPYLKKLIRGEYAA